ncbi:VOC family protein [Inmirania thermothiophila]|uniref:Glyoxalase-like protein n=1 Tax=Inmirania thermothiophila TaxID=1750597 RepID=A0A3N1XZN4_9GAMM|nr:VOC family protein [Inmirania thermothiophila]ROR32063.1 glyoxalase-like protein [Inmirania thermothiophila]
MRAAIDHLVVLAPDLDAGGAWVAARLGAAPRPGGAHPDMGTHNRLLRLGEGCYLEVIAVDPQAPAPPHPRWFGLDRPPPAPRLGAWVARCADLAAALGAHPEPPGPPRPMRRGDLRWEIAFPPDGTLPAGGVLPSLIRWPEGVHPAARLPDDGLRLHRLRLRHPDPGRIRRVLEALGLTAAPLEVAAGPPGLEALIDTPAGRRLL